ALRRLAPGARTWVVPNVVDEVFTPADGRPLGGGVRLLTVGLLDTPRKGVDVLLEALALVPERGRLRLDGVRAGELRAGSEELAAAPTGRLAGPLDPPSFAAALEDALAADFDRAAIAARTQEAFGRPAIARRLAEVYAELAK